MSKHARDTPKLQLDNYRSINALAETVNGLYKAECVFWEGPWASADDLELATLSWVHWFNHERIHSALGWVPPAEYEQHYYDRQTTPDKQPLAG